MGVRGGQNPHELVPIRCLLGDALEDGGTDIGEFDDLEPFDVRVLHPGRTLLEKLVLIHGLAQALGGDPSLRPDARSGRHFYDIFQLLADDRVLELLADRPQVEQVIASIEEFTREYFGGSEGVEVRPLDGFASISGFDIDSDVSTRLQSAYEATMPELYFGTEPLPSWMGSVGVLKTRARCFEPVPGHRNERDATDYGPLRGSTWPRDQDCCKGL